METLSVKLEITNLNELEALYNKLASILTKIEAFNPTITGVVTSSEISLTPPDAPR